MTEREFQTVGGFQIQEHIDLQDCHTDPIHETALLQSHGTFLQFEPSSLIVRSVAKNIDEYLDVNVSEVLGNPLNSALPGELVETIHEQVTPEDIERDYFVFERSDQTIAVYLFPVGDTCGLELEYRPSEDDLSREIMVQANRFLDRFRCHDGREELYEQAVRMIRDITGFGRVLLYKFDSDGNGEVVAEEKEEHMGSYLHHCFPASDIPEAARRLYRKNRVRLIPDVDYQPVPIVGPDGERELEELDLTYSILRSVPMVHRQYMKNMGVQSSCSISLMVRDELWGLISCHDEEPVSIGWTRRGLCKMIGEMIAQQIERLHVSSREDRLQTVDGLREQLDESRDDYQDLFDGLETHKSSIRSLMDSHAFYIRVRDSSRWITEHEDTDVEKKLTDPIRERLRSEKTYSVRSIENEMHENWSHSKRVSGFFASRIGRSNESFCVWFRPEHRETIQWGGDPRNPFDFDEEGTLSPRNSFEQWNEIVRGRCRKWTDLDRTTANELVRVFHELIIQIQSTLLEQVNEEKERLIREIDKRSRTDSLTGLLNREEFLRLLEKELERARRYEHPLSFALLDLDHFKQVNDTYGHPIGDDVLDAFGDLLKKTTRNSDIRGRYGGEEFSIVLPETPLDQARTWAERIRSSLRDQEFETDKGTFTVTCSIGLTAFQPNEDDRNTIIERADQALYQAKEDGRDNVNVK